MLKDFIFLSLTLNIAVFPKEAFRLFIISFTLLASATFPFSIVNDLLSKIPLLHQAFRFPFTKFSILLSLTYSIFFVLGINILLEALTRFKKYLRLGIVFIFLLNICLLLAFVFPIFRGDLFYTKEKINLPKEYLQTFQFFENQDQNTRIANLPQPTFWGWEFYKWGYGGSGFLWYGIKQPILDRAFDVWSKEDENYYWELSRALYRHGVWAIFSGFDLSVLQFKPGLLIDETYCDLLIERLDAALTDVENHR